jgi:hypothetical protein
MILEFRAGGTFFFIDREDIDTTSNYTSKDPSHPQAGTGASLAFDPSLC